ncbi:cyclic AMP response element-binding protein A-like isoform X2 [Chironomus tepperi]|uniref:cyclic AMP response element-binding protein A-like isoform X2 n=1 Tax=Chironomus tepperi TaxID=113505 RepID=UPI00391F4B13
MENLMNNDNDWLDSILSDELLNVADFGTQGSDLLMDDVFTNSLEDQPMFNDETFNEPIYSSAASDSGLSSDNLDLDINNDFDLLSSCLPSPGSDDHYVETTPTKSTAKSRRQEIVQPILKRSTRTNRNNMKYGSATMKNTSSNNNNVKKGEQKILHVKNASNKSRSIIVPVNSQNNKEFHSIKIVNSGSAQLKTANIKAVAANLLQKSKQGLLQKNILISKQDFEDDASMLNFDEIMQETDEMIAAHVDEDNDDDDESSAESCSSGYPKLVLTNEEKRLLSKEGISLPTSYPLTKQEERELKRIRRKIRNKISAQDSRKRKKEYIDGLEERVKQCSEENHQLIKRIKVLQSQNHDLMSKMKKLQNLLTKTTGKTAQPATCLMILLLSMALVAVPNLKLDKQSAINAKDLATAFGEQQNRRNLLFDLKSELEDLEPDPLMYIPNEHDYVENVYKYVSQLSNDNTSPPPAKRSKMLIDYDIDSMNEWELQKRSHYDDSNYSDSLSDISSNHEYELDSKHHLGLNKSDEVLNESDRILVQNIINLAATAALQKSSSS